MTAAAGAVKRVATAALPAVALPAAEAAPPPRGPLVGEITGRKATRAGGKGMK